MAAAHSEQSPDNSADARRPWGSVLELADIQGAETAHGPHFAAVAGEFSSDGA